MSRYQIIAAVMLVAGFSSACAGQPPRPAVPSAADVDDELSAYVPRLDRDRPLVAVIAPAGGAEVTDFVVPYGILARSGVADVVAVSTASGPVRMFPALTFQPEATTAEFDVDHPQGADYVIVPATHDPGDPALTDWIRTQASRGAIIVGICDGVLVLARAGLLAGRRATGHWYSLGRLERKHPDTDWVRTRRYVADGNVVTTTGVSASVPVSLALVAAIAGEERARQVARSHGVESWSPEHDSGAFGLTTRHVLGYAGDWLAFWRNDKLGLEVSDGVDEVTLALVADAWSRTHRSTVLTVAQAYGPVRTRSGLLLLPDAEAGKSQPNRMLGSIRDLPAGAALDRALSRIEDAYGARTADFVALQLEHPRAAPDGR